MDESDEVARQVDRARLAGSCLEVVVKLSDRPKGRILTQAADGQAVGIIKGRDWLLRDGDVLATERGQHVLVHLQAQRVMVLQFVAGVKNEATLLVNLGHVLGNRHWPVAARHGRLYVELVAEAAVMEATIREACQVLGIKGLHIDYEQRAAQSAVDFDRARSAPSSAPNSNSNRRSAAHSHHAHFH